jgi:hypothetical protein
VCKGPSCLLNQLHCYRFCRGLRYPRLELQRSGAVQKNYTQRSGGGGRPSRNGRAAIETKGKNGSKNYKNCSGHGTSELEKQTLGSPPWVRDREGRGLSGGTTASAMPRGDSGEATGEVGLALDARPSSRVHQRPTEGLRVLDILTTPPRACRGFTPFNWGKGRAGRQSKHLRHGPPAQGPPRHPHTPRQAPCPNAQFGRSLQQLVDHAAASRSSQAAGPKDWTQYTAEPVVWCTA